MAFTIEFSNRARNDIHDIVKYIQQDSPAAATKWRRKLHAKLRILRTTATSFGMAPENEFTRGDVRHLLFGQYRILYVVRDEMAFILTIRHGARQFMSGTDIDEVDRRQD